MAGLALRLLQIKKNIKWKQYYFADKNICISNLWKSSRCSSPMHHIPRFFFFLYAFVYSEESLSSPFIDSLILIIAFNQRPPPSHNGESTATLLATSQKAGYEGELFVTVPQTSTPVISKRFIWLIWCEKNTNRKHKIIPLLYGAWGKSVAYFFKDATVIRTKRNWYLSLSIHNMFPAVYGVRSIYRQFKEFQLHTKQFD